MSQVGRDGVMQRRIFLAALTALGLSAGCHREVDMTPLIERKVYLTDKFYDVEPLSEKRVFVVGYGGKILETKDGGRTWEQHASGTTNALYKVHFVDEKNGWIVGQSGTILRTEDGGASWKAVDSGSQRYLFSIDSLSPQHLIAVGEQATLLETKDGGATWEERQHKPAGATLTEEEKMLLQDPAFYDVQFVDDRNGYVVGEFGHILKTTDGGATWGERQASLVGEEILSALDLPTFYGVYFLDGQNGIATGLSGHIARTSDGGDQWFFDDVEEGHESTPFFRGQFFADGSGWAVGAAGEVVRKEGTGGTWKTADIGTRLNSWLREVTFIDEKNGWIVGGFGTILYTRDGGKTWIPTAA
jgi:photosystem II stability/assembly factor-like uncharacterized protein